MPGHDIITVGCSAGGVEALIALVSRLPRTLAASVFVVLHVAPSSESVLPSILQNAGHLPVTHARQGERFQKGHVYVAPPNAHLLVRETQLGLDHGPRQNGHRPAIDPLFRSAARAHGPRVVAAVLSGTRDDGTAGLATVRQHGGVCIAQDPDEARFPEMPRSAIEAAGVDHVLPVARIASLFVRLAQRPARTPARRAATAAATHDVLPLPLHRPTAAPRGTLAAPGTGAHRNAATTSKQRRGSRPGAEADSVGDGVPTGSVEAEARSVFVCPDCNGPLVEVADGPLLRFECRTGHTYSPGTLVASQYESMESALWAALNALQERAVLLRRMALRAHQRGQLASALRFEHEADDGEQRVHLLRGMLMRGLGEPAPGGAPAPARRPAARGTRNARGTGRTRRTGRT